MAAEDIESDAELDKTLPPASALRFDDPSELYAGMPKILKMTQHRPRPGERSEDYIRRLMDSRTPEEALTYIAFAALPKMAIWWAYECLRQSGDELTATERGMMDLVAAWTNNPDDDSRFRTMRNALYAPQVTPSVYLGLAVGWSGGPIAPNDPAPVPPHRAPRAVNSAVLSCLAKADLAQRGARLQRFVEQAASLFRTG